MNRRLASVLVGVWGVLACAPAIARTEPPATGAEPLAPQTPPGPGDAERRSADDLLRRLEEADKNIRSLRADVQYTKRYTEMEGGDEQIWRGTLHFDVLTAAAPGEPPRKRFAVIFNELLVPEPPEKPGGEKRWSRRAETKHLIFDGEWFVERNEATKQFSKRRVVKPGERIDPLRLGEGPFPLPIGQKRDEILKRFHAETPGPEAGLEDLPPERRARFADTVQLRLTPIGKTREARDLAEVRVWYRTSDLLPRLVRTRTAEGGQTQTLPINQEVNTPADPAVFNTDPPKSGWDVSIRDDFRAPADDEGVAR